MSIHQVFPDNYAHQLQEKRDRLQAQFAPFGAPELEVFDSPVSHYRQRAEFKIWHEDGRAHYAMYQPGEYKKPFVIESFPVGSELINQLMPQLLDVVNTSTELSKRLFQVEFLTTLSGQAVITLIYHRALQDSWETDARALAETLQVSVIGRSRGQKRVIGEDFVIEELQVNGDGYRYQQVETGFTQPNGRVCEKMLGWAQQAVRDCSGDLLELYCGNGNFTLPLSRCFDKVLATEISKTSVNSANYNLQMNSIDNVQVVRMSSEEFSQAMDGEREFRRLRGIELDDYNFSTVFVDPPRAGLDDHTCQIIQQFDTILYISCNPETLVNNLQVLTTTHSISDCALFDQFPYTHHVESGVLLQRRKD